MSNECKTEFDINELPEELLLLLFNNYLDFRNKLNAKRVCKLWHQLITEAFESTKALVITDDNSFAYDLSPFESMVKSYAFLDLNPLKQTKGSEKCSDMRLTSFESYLSFGLKKYPNLSSICFCFKSHKSDHIFKLILEICCDYNLINICLLTFGVIVMPYHEIEKFCALFTQLNQLYIETRLLWAQEITFRLFFRFLPKLKRLDLHVFKAIHNPRHEQLVIIDHNFMQNIVSNKCIKSFIASNTEHKYLHFEVNF